jgi:hypothetical protein
MSIMAELGSQKVEERGPPDPMATGIAVVSRPYIPRLENILAIDPVRNRPATAMEAAPVRLADDLHTHHVIGMQEDAALAQRHRGGARTKQPDRQCKEYQFFQLGCLLNEASSMVAITRNPSASGEFCRDQKFSQSLTDNLARDVDYSFPATSSSRTLDLGRSNWDLVSSASWRIEARRWLLMPADYSPGVSKTVSIQT